MSILKVTLTLVLSLLATVSLFLGNLISFNQGQTINFWREGTQRHLSLTSISPWHVSALTLSRNSTKAYYVNY